MPDLAISKCLPLHGRPSCWLSRHPSLTGLDKDKTQCGLLHIIHKGTKGEALQTLTIQNTSYHYKQVKKKMNASNISFHIFSWITIKCFIMQNSHKSFKCAFRTEIAFEVQNSWLRLCMYYTSYRGQHYLFSKKFKLCWNAQLHTYFNRRSSLIIDDLAGNLIFIC